TYYFTTDSIFTGNKKGIYTIGNEQDKPFVFVLSENKFPKPSKVKELIDPIIYIASDDERKALKNAKKPKKKLDDFWLDLGQDKEFARTLIRRYYKKVELANQFFTCHKEGWKTDMGMIYIIFGIPDEIFRSDTKETWNYKKKPNLPAVRFIFTRKRNTFGSYYFELINNPEYANIWYTAVDLWRKGMIE
ncbi:MAG: GWxTD domain-containing protein, partial [Bacteroidota bacterium]|nr:GWxTD domain-containing protein [Bacteroidota bacterium]